MTRYSRETTTKSNLRATVSDSPKYGNKACSLCARSRVPDDLTFKVSKYKTCGDVHLELSLIKPSSATCDAGQDAYREICCPQNGIFNVSLPSVKKPSLAVAAGLFLFWIFTRRIQNRRIRDASDYAHDDSTTGDEDSGLPKSDYKRMRDTELPKKAATDRPARRSKSNSRGRRSKSRDNLPISRGHRSKSRETSAKTKNGLPKCNQRSHSKSKGSRAGAMSNALVSQTFKQKKSSSCRQGRKGKTPRHPSNHLDMEDDQYYYLDDDCNTQMNDTVADTLGGETMDAVITQVV